MTSSADRWAKLSRLQKAYPTFETFLFDVMTGLLGFKCTRNQIDIARFMALADRLLMVQAQRSQAKTTIAACYVVWTWIQEPSHRFLVVSAGEALAKEISGWIIQILTHMEELECLRPDVGQRRSVEAFDVHYELKGPEKSPSLGCMPITGNIQGRRADTLLADDIESSRNSRTATARETLLDLMGDFNSICTHGKILFLGTPQSVDSVYNTLPSRGYKVRIWPGRYPTPKQMEAYGDCLAPMLAEDLVKDPSLGMGGGPAGDQGKPTDTVLLGEALLTEKEIAQGSARFSLQYLLNTALTDAERFPIKLGAVKFMHLSPDSGPMETFHTPIQSNLIKPPVGFSVPDRLYRVGNTGEEHGPYQGTHMYIDPAGGGLNGDETGWAVTRFLAGSVHVPGVGGVKGGYSPDSMDALVDLMLKFKISTCQIEENYGKGAFRVVLEPYVIRRYKERGLPPPLLEDDFVTGQKELRILDTLEPVFGSGKIVLNEALIHDDVQTIAQYASEKRKFYSLFYQLARITRDRGALLHDDRVEALAGAVRYWLPQMGLDEKTVIERAQKARLEDLHKITQQFGMPGLQPSHLSVRSSMLSRGRSSRLRRR